MIPDPVYRFELLRSLGLRPGTLNPVSAYVKAGQQAQAAGIAQDYWRVLLPQEREYIIRFKDCHNTPWMYTSGLCPVDYAIATDTYNPPPAWPEPPRRSYFPRPVNPLRIRGGALSFPEPPPGRSPMLLLPAPKIAGLLPPGPLITPSNTPYRQLATLTDYWQAVNTLTGLRFAGRET